MSRIRRPDLEDFLEGNLDPAKHAEVARLLESDPQWKREYENLAAMVSLLGTPLDSAPPSDLVANALRQIEARRALPVRRFALRFEKGLVALGAAGLAAALTLAGILPVPEPSQWVGTLHGGGDSLAGLPQSRDRVADECSGFVRLGRERPAIFEHRHTGACALVGARASADDARCRVAHGSHRDRSLASRAWPPRKGNFQWIPSFCVGFTHCVGFAPRC